MDQTAESESADHVRELFSTLREDLRGLRMAVLDWPDLAELRTDVAELGAGLTALRSEITQSSDVRQLRAQVAELCALVAEDAGQAELRAEMAELRTELRAQVAELGSLVAEDAGRAELRAETAELRTALGRDVIAASLVPVMEELGAIRADVVSLRRRIALRAEADPGASFGEQVDDIAAAVVERLRGVGEILDRTRR